MCSNHIRILMYGWDLWQIMKKTAIHVTRVLDSASQRHVMIGIHKLIQLVVM